MLAVQFFSIPDHQHMEVAWDPGPRMIQLNCSLSSVVITSAPCTVKLIFKAGGWRSQKEVQWNPLEVHAHGCCGNLQGVRLPKACMVLYNDSGNQEVLLCMSHLLLNVQPKTARGLLGYPKQAL